MSGSFIFTSESVTEGHPDKVADQISDAVLDAVLAKDPYGRVACETALTTGLVAVIGEITTSTYVDISRIARETICNIGYDNDAAGFDGNVCGVIVSIGEQSPDIDQGVSQAYEVRAGFESQDVISSQGAGDQGMMFGFAVNETNDLMPLPIWLAHRLSHRLAEVRKQNALSYLRPDGKTQVSIRYEDGKPVAVDTIVVSTQHDASVDVSPGGQLYSDIIEHVIKPVLPENLDTAGYKVFVNPTGRFELGGPKADAGLTGRKIIVDTYGGMARHGGGAFSGKDPSKVDRSAAYAARWVAKHVVASGAAERCEIQIAYAIGVARPVSVMVDTFGTERVDPAKISSVLEELFDLRPAAIIADLNLRRPIYAKTAAYGHFGRNDADMTWESVPKVDDLRRALGL
ncbi:MAG: methionine adenosyltransferase [Firmicutes bacterium]|nr:methionine adenosyltransferase [Bacillota bacterium]